MIVMFFDEQKNKWVIKDGHKIKYESESAAIAKKRLKAFRYWDAIKEQIKRG